MNDRINKHFSKQKTTIKPPGNATQKVKVKASGSTKQDARPAARFKTTPATTTVGLGAKSN
jgi:hypothetical protein